MWFQTKIPGGRPYQAVFTPPVSEPIDALLSLTEEQARAALTPPTEDQLRSLYPATPELFKQLHPDYVPPAPECPPCPPSGYKLIPEGEIQPAPEPTEPEPTPLPGGFGQVWNVNADASMLTNIKALWQDGRPVVIGPTSLDGIAYNQTLMLPKSRTTMGSGYRTTTLVYRGTGPAFKSATTEQTQSRIGHFRIERDGKDDTFVINGLSNMSSLEGIDMRGGRDQIVFLPAVDNSAAFYGDLYNIFAFSAQGSVIRVKGGNGVKNPLCHLMLRKLDIGRCNGPVMYFSDLRSESSHIEIVGALVDLRQNTFSSPHAVKFERCGDTPFVWLGGKVNAAGGKDVIVSDVPHAEDNWTIRGVQMRNNPSDPNFPRYQINTPTLKLPGNTNDGVCNWPPISGSPS